MVIYWSLIDEYQSFSLLIFSWSVHVSQYILLYLVHNVDRLLFLVQLKGHLHTTTFDFMVF